MWSPHATEYHAWSNLCQTYDVSHFPVMPVMMKGDPEARLDDADADMTPRPPVAETDVATVPGPPGSVDNHALVTSPAVSKNNSCLHKCQHCHMAFLTPAGLDQHLNQDHAAGTNLDRSHQDTRKLGRQKTIQQMLQAPVQEPPHPPLKQYECPLY